MSQAETIALVKAEPGKDADTWTLTCVEALKGKGDAASLRLAPVKKEDAEEIRKVLAVNGKTPMLLFAADVAHPPPGVASSSAQPRAATPHQQSGYLSVAGTWLAVESTDGKAWDATGFAQRLSGTWSGGTDMLIRCARYVLSEPAADVPVSVAAAWMDAPCLIAKLDGKIAGLAAIDLPGSKDRFLFVASPGGDRLFRPKQGAETFEDVTAAVKLASRSVRFAFGDFIGNGRLDLASWDGKELRLLEGRADGTFAPMLGGPMKIDDCLGLAPVRLAKDAPASLIVSGPHVPFMLSVRNNAWTRTEEIGIPRRVYRAVAASEVADLTGDGLPDILFPSSEGVLLIKGEAGRFQPSITWKTVIPSDAPFHAAIADFNQDGALDVLVAGGPTTQLYENDGHGNFTDVTASSGSFSYKPGAGVSAAIATDLNHDGRTDLAILHADAEFCYHFNRGFRCFGEEGELRLPALPAAQQQEAVGTVPNIGTVPQETVPKETVPAGDVGQVAGAVADFNGDGSLDLAVALADGRVACFYNDAFSKPILRVALKSGLPGPVTVSLWQGVKTPLCFSVLPVGPAGRVDFTLHSLEPRQCVLKWRRADGTERSLTVAIPEPLPDGGLDVTVGD